ncbi:MAG TPA: restriction endonuclease subunit R [Bacteroidales bacterium]|nr:restriction endonuclease subunit R [Bacteroidales bacterium]
MKPLKLPPCSLRIKEGPGNRLIYDTLRKKYVALTPEEWVRQHFVNYLTGWLGYPPGLIRVEAAFRLNSMLRRADILVHDRAGEPVLIVECKAPEVKITQEVFDQIINYNFSYEVRYLVVTNGITHFAARIDSAGRSFILLDHIPDYETITRTEP